MPRPTNYVLNQDQESKLALYLEAKYTSLKSNNADRIRLDTESWERYWGDVARRKGLAETIYPLSNIPLPVYAMVVEHFISRIEDSTSGDQPYWHFEAVGNADEDKARIYTDYFSWKLDQGGVHAAMLDSQLPTIIQSASVQKATYTRDEIHWIDMETPILHEKDTGNPVETISGGPVIHGEDEWEERPDPLDVAEFITPEGEEPPPRKMRQHLKLDPTVVFDEQKHEWKKPAAGIKRSQVIFSGAKSEHVKFDRIFCAMDAESFEKSDVMEMQDRALDWFRANWLERPWASWANYEPQFKTGNTTPKVGVTDANLGTGNPALTRQQENRAFDTVNPVRRVAEFWVERDVLGDGSLPPQRFVCWWDVDLKVLVNYEWQAKVSPDLKRPYTVTALAKEPNRWCGRSIWERGKPIFDAVDRLFNGEYYRTLQQANPPKGGDPGAAKEEPDSIVYDPTKYYELNKGRTIDELIQYAKVPDTNQRTQQVLEFLIFWIQLWLGISNIAQGDYAATPANATASGITKTLQEASLLGRRWIRRKLQADEEHLNKLVKIVIATMDEHQQEVFEFEDGDQRKAATIMGAEVRNLNVHVSVIEQQNFKESDINRCKAALGALEQFFAQLNPEVRKVMLPFFVNILNDLGFKNAAEMLPHFEDTPLNSDMGGALVMGPDGKPTLPPQEAPAAPPPPPEPPPPPPPPIKASLGVAVKWEQLNADERGQIMREIGVNATPEVTVEPPHGALDPNPTPPAPKQ